MYNEKLVQLVQHELSKSVVTVVDLALKLTVDPIDISNVLNIIESNMNVRKINNILYTTIEN